MQQCSLRLPDDWYTALIHHRSRSTKFEIGSTSCVGIHGIIFQVGNVRHKSPETVFNVDQGQDQCAVRLRTSMCRNQTGKNKEAQLSSESRSEVLTLRTSMVIYFNARARLMFWSSPGWTWSITFTAKVSPLSKLKASRWSIRGAGDSWGRLRLCLLVPAPAQRGFSARLFSRHVPTSQPRLSCSREVGGYALFYYCRGWGPGMWHND